MKMEHWSRSSILYMISEAGEQDATEREEAGVRAVNIATTGSCHCQFASNVVKFRISNGAKITDGSGVTHECIYEACLLRDRLYVKQILDTY
jgi:hypothetical protein